MNYFVWFVVFWFVLFSVSFLVRIEIEERYAIVPLNVRP